MKKSIKGVLIAIPAGLLTFATLNAKQAMEKEQPTIDCIDLQDLNTKTCMPGPNGHVCISFHNGQKNCRGTISVGSFD